MDVLDQSAELMRRGDRLRTRSARICATADEKVAKSWRLIAEAREAMAHAHGWESTERTARATADDLPAGR